MVCSRAKQIMESNSTAGVSAAVLALTSRMDSTAELDKIQIPTLIMHGEPDSIIPVSEAQSLHDKIKGSRLFVIPQAGHLSNLENPGAFSGPLLVQSVLHKERPLAGWGSTSFCLNHKVRKLTYSRAQFRGL